MDLKSFLSLTQWLQTTKTVAFRLDSACLGRPGDNQFDFLTSSYKDGVTELHFSPNLKIEISDPKEFEIFPDHVNFLSIDVINIVWFGNRSTLVKANMTVEA